MKTMQFGEFKSHFSEILKEIRKGEEIAISSGKKKEKLAVLVPYEKYMRKTRRQLDLMEKKGNFNIGTDFKFPRMPFLIYEVFA